MCFAQVNQDLKLSRIKILMIYAIKTYGFFYILQFASKTVSHNRLNKWTMSKYNELKQN